MDGIFYRGALIMRIKITFKNPKRKTYLPINTNYYLIKLIKQLTYEYRRYLSSLMPKDSGGKNFDIYTFSQLIIPERKIDNFMLGILSREFFWYISSPYYQFLGILVKELKARKRVKIYDTFFEVANVKFVPTPEFTDNEASFTCLSPVTVLKNSSASSKTNFQKYALPDNKEFYKMIEKDLMDKYRIIHKKPIDKLEFSLEFDPEYIKKRNNRITKVITIEREREAQEQIRCVLAPFKIKARPEVLQVIYDAGLGQMNALGFGMVEMVHHGHNGNGNHKRR